MTPVRVGTSATCNLSSSSPDSWDSPRSWVRTLVTSVARAPISSLEVCPSTSANTTPTATLPSSTWLQDVLARRICASVRVPSRTRRMLGSPRYHQNIAGSTAQARTPKASPNPRRSSTRLPAAALSQNNSGTTAEPATASVACMRPRMVNSASARMRSIPYQRSTARSQRPWLSV